MVTASHELRTPLTSIQGYLELLIAYGHSAPPEQQTLKEQRKIDISIPPSFAVQADPARLRQVLLNLGTNAIKYSPEGSPITFSACPVSDPVPAIIISIIDKGEGIPPQEVELLFQRFARLERDLNSATRGSGLGLYISRRLIEAMGGKIWVESSGVPGEGSSFRIQLRVP